jgi:hypothetical protein
MTYFIWLKCYENVGNENGNKNRRGRTANEREWGISRLGTFHTKDAKREIGREWGAKIYTHFHRR